MKLAFRLSIYYESRLVYNTIINEFILMSFSALFFIFPLHKKFYCSFVDFLNGFKLLDFVSLGHHGCLYPF